MALKGIENAFEEIIIENTGRMRVKNKSKSNGIQSLVNLVAVSNARQSARHWRLAVGGDEQISRMP